MNLVYAASLLLTLACLVLLDVRFRLVFARTPARSAVVLLAGLAFFTVWDAVGPTLTTPIALVGPDNSSLTVDAVVTQPVPIVVQRRWKKLLRR